MARGEGKCGGVRKKDGSGKGVGQKVKQKPLLIILGSLRGKLTEAMTLINSTEDEIHRLEEEGILKK